VEILTTWASSTLRAMKGDGEMENQKQVERLANYTIKFLHALKFGYHELVPRYLSKINESLVITRKEKELLRANFEKWLEILPQQLPEYKTLYLKKLGISPKHFDEPEAYMDRVGLRGNPTCDKNKAQFKLFLQDAVKETFGERFIDSEVQRELVNRWCAILISYLFCCRVCPKLFPRPKEHGKEKAGAPILIYQRMFVKDLNVMLSTLRIKKGSLTKSQAIQCFLRGYLNLKRGVGTIRQNLYR
jgi:hypothetical protein